MRFLSALLHAFILFGNASGLIAFPGAEGFGAAAVGGRAGTIYVVTNLNDSGAGSLRDAVSTEGRIIVFAMGGGKFLIRNREKPADIFLQSFKLPTES